MGHRHLRLGHGLGAAVVAGTLISFAAAPGIASAPVAQATATALTVTVGGTPTDSGTFHASNDGKKQTTTGTNKPQVAVLTGQSLVNAGTLDQDASATVVNKEGLSRACAGLAGDGATVVQVGDGNCLKGGKNLDLSLTGVDLTKLQIAGGSLGDGLPAAAKAALQQVIGPVTTGLSQGLTQGLTALGNPGVFADLGAIQGTCVAKPGSATGNASLADAGIRLRFPSQAGQPDVTLLNVPAHPAPNTDVSANLGDLTKIVLDAVKTDLNTSLTGALGPAAAVVDQAAVLNNALTQLSDQLKPVTSQTISLKLNTQKKTPGAIDVTALDLRVLPAASAAAGKELLRVQIGHVNCGPSGRVATAAAASPTVPTVVSAGVAGQPTQHQSPVGLYLVGLGALLLGGGATGGAFYLRRSRS